MTFICDYFVEVKNKQKSSKEISNKLKIMKQSSLYIKKDPQSWNSSIIAKEISTFQQDGPMVRR